MINNAFKTIARKITKSSVGPVTARRLVKYICHEFNLNLLELAHHSMGIMKYETPEISGEKFLIEKIIRPYFEKHSIARPVIFDIGANKGSYSLDLANHIPFAELLAFEPNPKTYKILQQKVAINKNIKCFEIGFGSTSMTSSIYTYKNELDSEHASVIKEVLQDLHKASDIEELVIKIEVLDNFCSSNKIDRINFLKIDTEGFELEVLKGGKKLLDEKKIDFIQFEFNEMNISSRVFLKDFYDILKGYDFYRLDSNRLIPIPDYHPINEIFRFQNILAIRKDVKI